MEFKELTNFNKMVTPTIIKAIFWIGVGFSILLGLIQIFSGMTSSYGGGIQVVLGLIILVVGPIVTRVYCELMILMFKMHEALQSINKKIQD